MTDCLFCRIVSGAQKSHVVHESPAAVAFLDRFPAAPGHTLVVPRFHAETLADLPDDAIGEFFREVKAVTRKVAQAMQPLAFNIGWNHGADAGQRVFHLHVHVIPRYSPGGRGIQALGSGEDRGELAEIAAAIKSA